VVGWASPVRLELSDRLMKLASRVSQVVLKLSVFGHQSRFNLERCEQVFLAGAELVFGVQQPLDQIPDDLGLSHGSAWP
jgi:hypothetical protein